MLRLFYCRAAADIWPQSRGPSLSACIVFCRGRDVRGSLVVIVLRRDSPSAVIKSSIIHNHTARRVDRMMSCNASNCRSRVFVAYYLPVSDDGLAAYPPIYDMICVIRHLPHKNVSFSQIIYCRCARNKHGRQHKKRKKCAFCLSLRQFSAAGAFSIPHCIVLLCAFSGPNMFKDTPRWW